MRYVLLLVILLYQLPVQAQPIEPAILGKPWRAYWITVPGESTNGPNIKADADKNYTLALA